MGTSLELNPDFNGEHGEYFVPVTLLVDHYIDENALNRAIEELSAKHRDYVLITSWVNDPDRHGLLIEWAYMPEGVARNGSIKSHDEPGLAESGGKTVGGVAFTARPTT